jgi:adenine-specific DNA methylase
MWVGLRNWLNGGYGKVGKGIRYLGSKEKHSFDILKKINKTVNSERDTFYDLFSGGLAVSVKAVDFGYKVIANDIKPEIVNLINDCFVGKIKDYYMKLPTKQNIKNATGITKNQLERFVKNDSDQTADAISEYEKSIKGEIQKENDKFVKELEQTKNRPKILKMQLGDVKKVFNEFRINQNTNIILVEAKNIHGEIKILKKWELL